MASFWISAGYGSLMQAIADQLAAVEDSDADGENEPSEQEVRGLLIDHMDLVQWRAEIC